MAAHYLCPHCKSHLKLAEDIIFLTKNNKGQSGLVLLSPRIGDYSVINDPTLNFEPGDHTNFICPVCYENLDAPEYDKNLAKVILREDGKEYEILFSKIVGEKCTYKKLGSDVQSFGEDTDKYTNFFGSEPNY